MDRIHLHVSGNRAPTLLLGLVLVLSCATLAVADDTPLQLPDSGLGATRAATTGKSQRYVLSMYIQSQCPSTQPSTT